MAEVVAVPSQVLATYVYPGGEALSVTVVVREGYPDALAEAMSQARRGLRELYADLCGIDAAAQPDEGAMP